MLLSATPTKIYRVVLDVGQGFNSTAVKKGGEKFEMLKADAEAQLEGANNRLGEVRCYASCTAQSFSYTPWILAAFLIAATVLCNCGIGCD